MGHKVLMLRKVVLLPLIQEKQISCRYGLQIKIKTTGSALVMLNRKNNGFKTFYLFKALVFLEQTLHGRLLSKVLLEGGHGAVSTQKLFFLSRQEEL